MSTIKDRQQQREILHGYYAVYDSWLTDHDISCRKGCASCCTQSVNVTTLEAEIVLEFLLNNLRQAESTRIARLHDPPHSPRYTTNQFAKLCLEQTGSHIEEEEWNFQSCPFLKDQSCSIYTARPFGCRSFISSIPCHEQGAAVIPPMVLTIATVITQLIEHLDEGRPWGNMVHVLKKLIVTPNLANGVDGMMGRNLLVSRKIPGFLIPPDEEKEVSELLLQLIPDQASRQEFGLIYNV